MKIFTLLLLTLISTISVRSENSAQLISAEENEYCISETDDIIRNDKYLKIREWNRHEEVASLFCINYIKDFNICLKSNLKKESVLDKPTRCFFNTLGKNILNSNIFKNSGIARKNILSDDKISQYCETIENILEVELDSKSTLVAVKYPLCKFSGTDQENLKNKIMLCENLELNLNKINDFNVFQDYISGLDEFMKINMCKSILTLIK